MVTDVELLEELKRRPRGTYRLEVDFYMFPGPFRDKGSRPYFAYGLLTVESQSSFILGHELLHVETTLEDLWGTVPLHLARSFATLSTVPRQVRVRTRLLEQLLQPLAEELGFRLTRSSALRTLDEVKQMMLDRFT